MSTKPSSLAFTRRRYFAQGSPTRAIRGATWLCAWVALCLVGFEGHGLCDAVEARPHEASQVHMGMPFRFLVYSPDEAAANSAIAAAFARVAELDRKLSDYDPMSELSRLNATAGNGERKAISADLFAVLSAARRLSLRTDGAFDVTVGPYVRLWRRARRSHQLPPTGRLAEARAAVGYQGLMLDSESRSAELTKLGMRLDLGGIAVGYTLDQVAEIFRERGLSEFLLDASGDILCGDAPPGEDAWRVGVAVVDAPDGNPTLHLRLVNSAVTTSGDAFQHVEIAGVRYSHIVDPRTGLGLTTPSSVTVIAPTGIAADSLATAASVLGPDRGMELIEATDGTAVIFSAIIDNHPNTRHSSRVARFLDQ